MKLLEASGFRELDQRQNDKLVVTLYWIEKTMHTFVTVEDGKTGNNFSVDVPSPDRALEYFRHPMVHSPFENGVRKLYAATEADQ